MVNEYKDFGWRCGQCKRQFALKETAKLCCTDMGCKKQTTNGVLAHVCGVTIHDKRFYFCKDCTKKRNNKA